MPLFDDAGWQEVAAWFVVALVLLLLLLLLVFLKRRMLEKASVRGVEFQ
jgi:Mg2+ and Co2+ transporter CorA